MEIFMVDVTIKGLIQVNAESYEHAEELVEQAHREMYDGIHLDKIRVYDVELEIEL